MACASWARWSMRGAIWKELPIGTVPSGRQRVRFLPGARELGGELDPGSLDDPHWRGRAVTPRSTLPRILFLTGTYAVGTALRRRSMDILYEQVAGLDVHKDTVVACVRIVAEGKTKRECRSFSTTTDQLVELRAWLEECRCT